MFICGLLCGLLINKSWITKMPQSCEQVSTNFQLYQHSKRITFHVEDFYRVFMCKIYSDVYK